eukprot:177037-Amorphochlora_amoeboformis.AAC.1
MSFSAVVGDSQESRETRIQPGSRIIPGVPEWLPSASRVALLTGFLLHLRLCRLESNKNRVEMGSSSSKNEDTIRWRLKYEDLKKESETTIRELLVLQEANSRNLRYAYGAAAGLSVVCLAGGIFLGRRVFYSNDLMRSLVGRGVQMQKKIFADELEAVRARGLAETEKAGRFAIRGLAKDLLQVADNLERASIMEAESEGVQMTYRNMSEVLKAHRITPIDIQLGELEDTKEEE